MSIELKLLANGTWNQKDTWHGIGDGMVVISESRLCKFRLTYRAKVNQLQRKI